MLRDLTITAVSSLALLACATAAGGQTAEDQARENQAAPPPYEAPAGLEEATDGPPDVALYVMSDADTTVYLMGTIHILRPDVDWKTPEYEAAFAEADAVYIEADTSDAAMSDVQSYVLAEAMNPEGVTLSSYFDEAERETLAGVFEELGVPMSAFEPMRPWFASLNLGVVGIQRLGGDPEAGVETLIEADAEAAGKPVRSFETVMHQMALLTGLPDEAWADALIAEAEDLGDFEGYFSELVGAWYDGRMDVVARVMNEGFEAAPILGETLLYARNAEWAAQLAELMETETGTYLVAVGAGHLAGERSVQDQLTDLGYTVSDAR